MALREGLRGHWAKRLEAVLEQSRWRRSRRSNVSNCGGKLKYQRRRKSYDLVRVLAKVDLPKSLLCWLAFAEKAVAPVDRRYGIEAGSGYGRIGNPDCVERDQGIV